MSLIETFRSTLFECTQNVYIQDNTGIGTILDDDIPPLIYIFDQEVQEGNDGFVVQVFTVTLDDPSGKPIIVNFDTIVGTATPDVDYQKSNWETTKFSRR